MNSKNIGIAMAIIIVLILIMVFATRDSAEEETTTPSDDTSQVQPESDEDQPSDADTSNDEDQSTTDSDEDEVEVELTPVDDNVDTPQPSNTDNVLPVDWDSLTLAEKIELNPYNCEDTTKIRADNGQCLVDQVLEAPSEEVTDVQDETGQSSETEDTQTEETSSTQESDDSEDIQQTDTSQSEEEDEEEDDNSGNNNNNGNNSRNTSPTPTPKAKSLAIEVGPQAQIYLFPTGQSRQRLTTPGIAWYVKVTDLIDGVETTKSYSAECPEGFDSAVGNNEVRYPNSELETSYTGCKITFTNGDQTLIVDATYITPSAELLDAVS